MERAIREGRRGMSLVSNSHKFIYVSGGKCATGSIMNAFGKVPDVKTYMLEKKVPHDWKLFNKHMPAKVMRKRLGQQIWDSYYKFSFVRNPYDWVSSVFFFHVKRRMKGYTSPSDGKLREPHIRLVVDYCKSPIGRRFDDTINIRSQHDFISDVDGNIIIDYVGKVENLNVDFKRICKKINVPYHEPENRNVSGSKKTPYQDRYTPEARKMVEKYFGKDIKAFGYTFE